MAGLTVALWIPAFAGMTEDEGGNDEVRRGEGSDARTPAGGTPALRWGEKPSPPSEAISPRRYLFAPLRLCAFALGFPPLAHHHAHGGAVEAVIAVGMMVWSAAIMPSHLSLG